MILNDSEMFSILFLFPLHSSAMIFNKLFFVFFRTVSGSDGSDTSAEALNVYFEGWCLRESETATNMTNVKRLLLQGPTLESLPIHCLVHLSWQTLESFRPLPTASEPLKMWPHTLKRTPQTLHCAQNHKSQLSQLQKIAKQRTMKE